MIRYGKQSKLEQTEVLRRARLFFGEAGLGLEESEIDDCHLRFEGGGGFVDVAVCANDNGTEVDISAREWENPAREFLGKI